MQLSSLNLALSSLWQTDLGMQARSILYKYGADAHIYLPGIGTVNGLTAGNYLDSAGTTAATVDNPVGLSLDALQAMTLGAELVVGASNFSNNGWTPSGSGGVKIASGAIGSLYGLYGSIGPTYLMVVVVSAISGTITPYLGSSTQSVITSPGTYQYVVKPSAGAYFYLDAPAATTATVTSVSVREIPGIHATQATTANKPILRRGLLNLLTYSQDASNAAWAKISATATASKITEAAGSSQHYISQSIDMPDGPVTFAAIFAPAERSWATMYLGSVNSSVWFNSSTGVIGTTGASITASIASLANGYKLCVITGTQTGLGAITRGLYIADADNSNTYTGDGTSGILFGGAGLFQGTYTAQQIIDAGGIPLTTTAAASNPSAGKYSWQFDGSNDSLSLSAPLFQMSDDHCVIVGVSPQSALSSVSFFQQAGGGTPYVPALGLSSGVPLAYWRDDASTTENLSAGTAVAAGAVCVITARKVVNTKVLRQNGVQKASGATVMGISTVTSGLIGFGGGSYWNGSIYPVIAIKGTVTDSDLLTLERFVGQLSGVSI